MFNSQLLDTKVVAEDIIGHLERVIIQANAILPSNPIKEIYLANPELLRVSSAVLKGRLAAGHAKADLLKALRMPFNTKLVSLPLSR